MSLLGGQNNESVEEYSDEYLLSESAKSASLFAILVRRYEEPFLRKALSIIRNEKDAEDIVQDTFLKIYIHSNKFQDRDGATFKSWAYRILINTAFTHYQKIKKKNNNFLELEPDMYEVLADARDEVKDREVSNLAFNLLGKLPEQMSRALRLFFLEEYSQKEIAEMEGTSISAIKTRIYRAKGALQEAAKSQGDIIT